jgi:hypothetical protein
MSDARGGMSSMCTSPPSTGCGGGGAVSSPLLQSRCKGSGLTHWPAGPDLESATIRIRVRPAKN